jgi:hypothetical protein
MSEPIENHPLAPYGWDAAWAVAFAPHASAGLEPARVVVELRRHYYAVVTASGELLAECTGKFHHDAKRDPVAYPAVGDWVAVAPSAAAEGRAQLHAKLLADPRVTNFEKINARHLTVGDLPRDEFDAVVTDLSFISLKVVLPAIWPFVRPGGVLIALVKPQFEAGKAEVDKGRGIIRDPAVQEAVLDDIRTFSLGLLRGAALLGTIDSPITGTDGNREFLLGLRRTA